VLTDLGRKLGKEVVIAKDTPGFIVNRLLFPYILDAIRMFEEGIAGRDEIDISMQLAASYPMGPLLLADYIGLDTIVSVSQTLFEGIGEQRMKAPKLLEEMVNAGYCGVKSGKGFYNYNQPADEGDRKAKLYLEISNILS
jgi:3-hydroxybutyryl-CoA dehydrogenase